MPIQERFCVRVLLMREGEVWVAQGLEYDIAAQGATINAAKAAFEKTFVGQIIVDAKHDQRPLEGIGKAPNTLS